MAHEEDFNSHALIQFSSLFSHLVSRPFVSEFSSQRDLKWYATVRNQTYHSLSSKRKVNKLIRMLCLCWKSHERWELIKEPVRSGQMKPQDLKASNTCARWADNSPSTPFKIIRSWYSHGNISGRIAKTIVVTALTVAFFFFFSPTYDHAQHYTFCASTIIQWVWLLFTRILWTVINLKKKLSYKIYLEQKQNKTKTCLRCISKIHV